MTTRFRLLLTTLAFGAALTPLGCGGATNVGDRYGDKDEDSATAVDLSAYREEFDFAPAPDFTTGELPSDNDNDGANASAIDRTKLWYTYDDDGDYEPPEHLASQDLFSVLVGTTDDMDEAKRLKRKAYHATDREDISITFEPPLFKVKIGGFTNLNSARGALYDLKEAGIPDAIIIHERVR
jgi:hypothetical protein